MLTSCKDKVIKVSFDADNGSEIVTVEVVEGKEFSIPKDPVKEGYEFLYWGLNGEVEPLESHDLGDAFLLYDEFSFMLEYYKEEIIFRTTGINFVNSYSFD